MISPEGRWGGAMTSRPLPDAEDEVADIEPATRDLLARIWLSQAATELRVARSFAVVHEALAALGADTGIVATAARAIDDEHRHTLLCRTMAERYAGGEVVETPALPFDPPKHEGAQSQEVRRALWVIGQCALNETFASAYLSLCNERAESPLTRAALRELLSDEIDHARVGWAYVTALPHRLRPAITEWLVPLATANLREWRKVQLAGDDALVRHGIPDAREVEAALVHALRDLITPGFAHAGLDVRSLEGWIASGANT